MRETLVLVLVVSSLFLGAFTGYSSSSIEAESGAESITTTMTVNKTNIEVDESFRLVVSIANGWYWKLRDISFSINFPQLLPRYFTLIAGKNTDNVSYNSTGTNVSVTMEEIGWNKTEIFYLIGKFHRTGDFRVNPSDVKLKKVRGERIEVQDSIPMTGLTLNVEEKEERVLPPGGKWDIELYLYFVLLVLPILLLSGLTYIGRRKPY